jgi:hypothetical protein
VGTINYYANGAKGVAKEHLEVYQLGTTAILSDFKRLEIHGRDRTRRKKLMNQNKGQGRMVSDFIEAIRSGRESPINWAESRAVTLASFAARQSVVRRTPVVIETVGDAGSE